VGQALRHIIFDGARSDHDRAADLLRFTRDCTPHSLTPQNLAQIFLNLGNLAENDPGVDAFLASDTARKEVTRLVAIGRRKIDAFEPRNLAETLRGLAFIGRGDETFAEALFARSTGLIDEFSATDLVTVLGAARLLDFDKGNFLDGVNRVLAENFHESDFNNLELALGALYLANLDQSETAAALGERALQRLDTLETRHIGMLAAAFQKLPRLPIDYCFNLAGELLQRIKSEPEAIPAREAVEIIELLGRREARHDRFIAAFCAEYRSRLPDFSTEEIRETARGLAILQENNPVFFRELGEAALRRLDDLDAVDIAVIAWAHTSLGIRNDGLFNRLAGAMNGRYSELSPGSAASLAWAYSLLGNPVGRSVVANAGRVLRAQDHEVFHARQLHIAEVAVGLVPPGRCPDVIAEHARDEDRSGVLNGFESAVWEAIRRLDIKGLTAEPFQVVEGLRPDFVISYGERRIVLECDGARYHLNSSGEMRGNDKLQDLVFQRCGYEVVHILDHNFIGLSLVERERYLLSQLKLGAIS
jgi:very-short-patch-repair endonuclease